MNVQNILCPIDYSEYSNAILEYASKLAKETDAELHIIHVFDDTTPYENGMGIPTLSAADIQEQKQALEKVVPKDKGVRYVHQLVRGWPSDGILHYCENNPIDLIVMGTHGRKGVSRMLMGSVAEAVMRRADCPVLTIRAPIKTLEKSM